MQDLFIITKTELDYNILSEDINIEIPNNNSDNKGISYGKKENYIVIPIHNFNVIRDDGYFEFTEETTNNLKINNWFFNDLEFHRIKSAKRILTIIKKHYPEVIILDGFENIINIDEI